MDLYLVSPLNIRRKFLQKEFFVYGFGRLSSGILPPFRTVFFYKMKRETPQTQRKATVPITTVAVE